MTMPSEAQLDDIQWRMGHQFFRIDLPIAMREDGHKAMTAIRALRAEVARLNAALDSANPARWKARQRAEQEGTPHDAA